MEVGPWRNIALAQKKGNRRLGKRHAVEESLAFPTQIGVSVVASQGSGERSVTLAGCLYAKSWRRSEGEQRAHGCLLRQIYKEVATLKGQPLICFFFNLEKFYDSVCMCLHKLIGLALDRNFPKPLLYTAMPANLAQSMQPTSGLLTRKQIRTCGTVQHSAVCER